MIIATDLDGTFLGGSIEERHRLYKWIKRTPEVRLIFVTGRGLESVIPLLQDAVVPVPEYIICDVGATVVETTAFAPMHAIQGEIEAVWPGSMKVLELFSKYAELRPQEVPQQRRCSFFISDTSNLSQMKEDAESINCDIIYSAGKYLDVIPKNINKGTTLRKLVDHLSYSPENVLVAGDTLNDLHMFTAGFKGVVVGNSEDALVERTRSIEGIYHASSPGAGGIHEAIGHFNWFSEKKNDRPEQRPSKTVGRSEQLVVVYHRFPYETRVVDGQKIRVKPKSPNGIIPTLQRFFANNRAGVWVAWEEVAQINETLSNVKIDEKEFPNLTASRVGLTKNEIEIFYKKFSKEAFWPAIFSFVDKVKIEHKHWEIFRNVNKKFADKVAAEAERGATIWIHDYNLWLVPGMLRESRPDLIISFFHHTSFPPATIFNVLPWRREIIGSLLQCDHVGFHIPRYIENFVDVTKSMFPVRVREVKNAAPKFLTYSAALGVEKMTTLIETPERKIRLSANPVGVDVGNIRQLFMKKGTLALVEKFKKLFAEQQLVLSVERLDYVKGPIEKILAFEKFLEENPERHGKVTLINICTPAADGMKIYERTKQELEQAVGRINGRFSRIDWVPIRLFFKSVPFEELLAYYAVAKIAWITPLRDGLNLVAKEYVAVQGQLEQPDGVLILSEFAGASVDLHYAVLTNPYDIQSLKNSLAEALNLEPQDQLSRIQRLYEQVEYYDIEHWAQKYQEQLSADLQD